MTLRIERVLGVFQHRMARGLMGQKPWRDRDSMWVYQPLAEAMEEAGLQEVETYFSRLQNTVTQFIVTRIIMYLCLSV